MTAYKPRELSQRDVEVLEELIFSKRLFPLSQKESSEKIRFVLPAASAIEAPEFFLSLKADQQKIHLAFKPTTESSFTQSLSTFGGKEAIPKDFLTAVIAFCSQKIITALEVFLQTPIALDEETGKESETAEEKKICFEIINRNAVVEIQGEINLPLVLLKKILSMAATFPKTERADLGNCSLQGELLIGTAKIPPLQWSKLMPGDLIFFEEPSACLTGDCFFQLNNGPRISLFVETKQLQSLILPLEQVASSGFAPPPLSEEEKNQSEQEQELASLEKIVTIELTFSVGTLSLTLDEITHLAKTNKLAHPLNLNRPLKILAQGQSIGVGELIELHGQHALFITQLTLKNER